ncbi:MAG: LuxR C-terminal-related transcriptional regulator, partial [Chloroflexi bacterium]|nr:LuxR C-terminal-related transcriptional regulator [Chloroflexota bacterium]
LIRLGLTNREIGTQLSITEHTVKRHVAGLMVKLNVSRRTQIAVIAVEEGWRYDSDRVEN